MTAGTTKTSVVVVAMAAVAYTFAAQPAPRLRLQLEDYAQLPITGELDGQNTRGQLARVNFLRDEPGGRRFFVNDLNGPLYILDKQTKTSTVYLDFNGLGGRPGLFPKFTFERNFATGLTNFLFDPDYPRNGVFYTMHMEDPNGPGAPMPKPGVVAGLDLTGYATTPAIPTPTVDGKIEREVVLIEWTDRNPANATFEGTARELLRLQHPLPQHPLGEMTFNPVARPGDPDWRVMYVGAGDSGSGDQKDSRRINPQRLDTLVGKIWRIVPDLREHTTTSTVSENGRYRIPNDNPFTTLEGARKEIWAYGLRNPHRLIWDVDPARPKEPRLLAFHIGLVSWETVVVIRKGANYGWPMREGTRGEVAGRDGADSGGRHDSDSDLRHRRARHGHADVSGAAVPAPAGRRRRHRQRLHLSRQPDSRAARQARVRGHHDRTGVVRRACRPPRRRRWRPGDGGADSRDRHGTARAGDRGVPRTRRQGRGAPRRRPDLGPWTRGPAVRGRRGRRALRPDEARRHDPEGRRRRGHDRARDDRDRASGDRAGGPRWRGPHSRAGRGPEESRAGHAGLDRRREDAPTTPRARPATATGRRAR